MEESQSDFYEDYINEMIQAEIKLEEAIYFANLPVEDRLVSMLSEELAAAIDKQIMETLIIDAKQYNELDELIVTINYRAPEVEYIQVDFTIEDYTSPLGEMVDISDLESDAK